MASVAGLSFCPSIKSPLALRKSFIFFSFPSKPVKSSNGFQYFFQSPVSIRNRLPIVAVVARRPHRVQEDLEDEGSSDIEPFDFDELIDEEDEQEWGSEEDESEERESEDEDDYEEEELPFIEHDEYADKEPVSSLEEKTFTIDEERLKREQPISELNPSEVNNQGKHLEPYPGASSRPDESNNVEKQHVQVPDHKAWRQEEENTNSYERFTVSMQQKGNNAALGNIGWEVPLRTVNSVQPGQGPEKYAQNYGTVGMRITNDSPGTYLSPPQQIAAQRDAVMQKLSGPKIYVGNLPDDMDGTSLARLFSQAGTVDAAEVVMDRLTGRSRRFGFVTMSTAEEAKKACEMFYGSTVAGKVLNVGTAAASGTRLRQQPSQLPYTLFVANLPYEVDSHTLRSIFTEYGNVSKSYVVYNRVTGFSRGFGFVTLSSQSEVENAIVAVDGKVFGGRTLRVSPSKPLSL